MSARPPVEDPQLLEAAEHIGSRTRRSWIKTALLVGLVCILIQLLIGLFLLYEMRELVGRVERQNVAQLIAIEEARAADAQDAAAQQKILARLGERIVPKSDILALEREVEQLQVVARNLRRAVRTLNQTLQEQGVAGGG